jgi:hypothetical protein
MSYKPLTFIIVTQNAAPWRKDFKDRSKPSHHNKKQLNKLQPNITMNLAQRQDRFLYQLFQRHAQHVGALLDDRAVDLGCEGGCLELLGHRLDLDVEDALRGPHDGASRDKARQLVAGEEYLLHIAEGLDLGADAEAVALDRANEGLIVACRGQDGAGMLQVLLWVLLVIDVVQEAHDAPIIGILALLRGEVAHRRLDRESVAVQVVVVVVLAPQAQGGFAVHLGSSLSPRAIGRRRSGSSSRARRPARPGSGRAGPDGGSGG